MSKVSIQGDPNGTGNFTIKAPNSNNNRQFDLPDENGTIATIENIPPGYEDQDALDLFNVTGSAPVYACRAWVNFDGTGTVSIRDSGNVSSITDISVGTCRVNFTTAMPDANYSAVAIGGSFGAQRTTELSNFGNFSTTSFRIVTRQAGTVNEADCDVVCVSVFR